MKIMIFALSLFLTVSYGWANIYVPPGAQINELLWNENGDWQLEISYFWFETGFLDSVIISTANYRYSVQLPELAEFTSGMYVLNKQLCNNQFDIQPLGDSVFIKTYSGDSFYYYPDEHNIIFGDYPNSTIAKPNTGSSIALIEGYEQWFVMDASPTLGRANTLEGCTGTLNGTVYHSNQQPVISTHAFVFDFEFQLSNNGTYSTHLILGNHTLNKIGFRYIGFDDYSWFTIEPVEISIEPDQVYENVDIFITDPDFLSVNEHALENPITAFPNPAFKKLFLELNKVVLGKELEIRVFDIAGKEVARYVKPVAPLLEIELPDSFRAGMYLFEFRIDNQWIQNKQVLVNSFK